MSFEDPYAVQKVQQNQYFTQNDGSQLVTCSGTEVSDRYNKPNDGSFMFGSSFLNA